MHPLAFRDALIVALEKEIENVGRQLRRGAWDGEAAGKRLCGTIDGLEKAIGIAKAEHLKIEQLDEADEDDDL